MAYNFKEIEQKWQTFWRENNTYKVTEDISKPKYYVLDMFPYPSGAGLHVGHPLGYIASDIYSRYKRLHGFNVLHPMGFDAFGLPAEQYAIQTGQHPAVTTAINIRRYREQLDKIGLSFDWSRQVNTSEPNYYKWTQWVFLKMYNHWFNKSTQRAEPISELIVEFEKNGNLSINAACSKTPRFESAVWNGMDEAEQQEILMNYRLTYRSSAKVNWCAELGVLANDEVKEGFSVRGGYPVTQKSMEQWQLRVTAYAERLLTGLDNLDWSDSLKEMQRNWIGRSEGAEVYFKIADKDLKIKVFTTRPDTIYGATFMVIAPESELVQRITTFGQTEEVDAYIEKTAKRSERERLADAKTISGVFSGSYCINPFTGKQIPVWIADYVLAGYGTGAIMAVPAHDSRDYAFAKHFGLEIIPVVDGGDISESSYDAKEGKMINSDFLNGLDVKDAVTTAISAIQQNELGNGTVNYRLRDAVFSRQRYWGEPFPIYYKDGIAYPLSEEKLPLELPKLSEIKTTESGEPPLARATAWHTPEGYPFELSTMPGFAGSSAYYLRYMDPTNNDALVSPEANAYWQDVDLYVGGTEHAVGHLIYSRFWNKFLFDLNYVVKDEPFRKLLNQGMIQGRSSFVYRIKGENTFVSFGLRNDFETTEIHVDINLVHNDILNVELFKKWRQEYSDAKFIYEEDGKYHCGWAVEKMSKSMFNVVNPDDIAEKYGADTLRFYEMFLGPIEISKPWDTNGIEGVSRFLNKLWKLYHPKQEKFSLTDDEPSKDELKILHKTIKKIDDDIEKFSLNTAVSAYMVCVNELGALKCNKRKILEPLVVLLSPFAPHIAEELWQKCGHVESITRANFPVAEQEYLQDDTVNYPIAFNGKTRFTLTLPVSTSKQEVEKIALADSRTIERLAGVVPKKVIFVPGKMLNIVV